MYKGKTQNIARLARMRKGKVRFDTKIKGRKCTLYCSLVDITLPYIKGLKLKMAFTNDYIENGMMLLTDVE